MLKYALLGFLNYSSMSGYELKQYMDVSTSNFWNAKLSQIYTVLKALEEDKLITSTIHPQEDKPDKRIYTITEEGKSDLLSWLNEPQTEQTPPKNTFLLKLFFSAQTEKDNILTQLRLQRSIHQHQLDHPKNKANLFIKEVVKNNPKLKTDALFWESTRRFGELYEEMYINWLNETINIVEEQL